MDDQQKNQTTHFGYQQVPVAEKTARVSAIFDTVANRYDVMNDVLSFGLHRLWKRIAIIISGVKSGDKVLDIAGGTGDVTYLLAKRVGNEGLVVLADINNKMLAVGRERLINRGMTQNIRYVQADAENLPFADNSFDCITIAFGLRNITNKTAALNAMHRVLKPGGQLVILEFSKPSLPGLQPLYDAYSFTILPWLGKVITGSETSYRYLAESIRKHPKQEELQALLINSGYSACQYHNLTGGIVAIHRGYKETHC